LNGEDHVCHGAGTPYVTTVVTMSCIVQQHFSTYVSIGKSGVPRFKN
jgi:hypothetical protein